MLQLSAKKGQKSKKVTALHRDFSKRGQNVWMQTKHDARKNKCLQGRNYELCRETVHVHSELTLCKSECAQGKNEKLLSRKYNTWEDSYDPSVVINECTSLGKGSDVSDNASPDSIFSEVKNTCSKRISMYVFSAIMCYIYVFYLRIEVGK